MRSLQASLLIVFSCLFLLTPAAAADCPRADALGTSRVMTVNPDQHPRVGIKSFPETLPLADKEVVLTFDDGPVPATTSQVLRALAQECVRATFFVVGQNARAYPQLLRRMAEEGHTLAHHTYSHPNLKQVPFETALSNIDQGIAAVEAVLRPTGLRSAPFFRFPYFESTPALLDTLQSRHYAVFGADLWASDWEHMTPDQTYRKITERLTRSRKGIILFHDVQQRTAAMMPAFLQFLRENGYKVVHIVAARQP